MMVFELCKCDEKMFNTKHLMVNDIIYFKKDESILFSEWTVGRVDGPAGLIQAGAELGS